MHGIELCGEERCALRPLAPLPAFSPLAGSMPPGTPQLPLSPPGPEARNGLSLARNRSPFRSPHPGVIVPGLPLRSLRCSLPARSAFRSAAGNGLPRPRPLRHVGPSLVRYHARPALPRSPLPRLDFCIHPRSMRSTAVVTGQSAFPERPISARSPFSSIASFENGSQFLDRYVPGGWLFLKPLGTFLTMLPQAIWVKKI